MKYVAVAFLAVILAALIFLGGLWMGSRANAEKVSNAEIHEKVNQETIGLHKRFDAVDAKLDILLNVATNSMARDFRR
ncbi:MAG: hypothetical protein IJI36_17130 [Kiritimatiellae bacterium]|nr:hypothetical protein [Kiritimatiellia bacterium]